MSTPSAKQVEAMVKGIGELGLPFSDAEIRKALRLNNYNQETATNYLIEFSMNNQG